MEVVSREFRGPALCMDVWERLVVFGMGPDLHLAVSSGISGKGSFGEARGIVRNVSTFGVVCVLSNLSVFSKFRLGAPSFSGPHQMSMG